MLHPLMRRDERNRDTSAVVLAFLFGVAARQNRDTLLRCIPETALTELLFVQAYSCAFASSIRVAIPIPSGGQCKPLGTYDFVSDENPNKNRAREMYKMLGDIEEHLKKIQPRGDKRVNMWCHTCHHGRPRPMTLDEELQRTVSEEWIASRPRRLLGSQEEYYGRAAFDFGETSLNVFGYTLLENSDIVRAIQVFRLNAETFPDSSNVWDSLAEGYLKAGDIKKAQENYEKALSLDPDNQGAKDVLKKIKESPPK